MSANDSKDFALTAIVDFAWDCFQEGVWWGGNEDSPDEHAWKVETLSELCAFLEDKGIDVLVRGSVPEWMESVCAHCATPRTNHGLLSHTYMGSGSYALAPQSTSEDEK